MKKIISKIALTVLVISSMPVHASLGKTLQDGTRSMLQSMKSSKSAQIALITGSLTAMAVLVTSYDTYRNSKNRRMTKTETCVEASLAALMLSGFTATLSWGLAKTFGLK